jgi:hypothetical protein
LETTLFYTHLIDFSDEEFTVRAAETLEEAMQVIESGFDCICEMEAVNVFRKGK